MTYEPEVEAYMRALSVNEGLDTFVRQAESQKRIDKLAEDGQVKAIAMFVADQIEPLKKQIATLQARLDELETKGIDYLGVYQRSQTYKRGSMVTSEGSLWAAIQVVEPGEAPGNSLKWQLAAKAGRDSRAPTNHSGRPR